MINKKIANDYIKEFRERFSKYLRKDIGLISALHLAKEGGAIIEFTIGINLPNKDQYKGSSKSIGNALKNIKQHTFGGNLNGFSFSGTNIILEPGRIILIKSDEPSQWEHNAVLEDIDRVLTGGTIR